MFLCSVIYSSSKATSTPYIYTLSLHDALPILSKAANAPQLASDLRQLVASVNPNAPVSEVRAMDAVVAASTSSLRSEEHTSELQSLRHLVCRLLLEKKKTQKQKHHTQTTQPYV